MFETVEIIKSGDVKHHYEMCSEQTYQSDLLLSTSVTSVSSE